MSSEFGFHTTGQEAFDVLSSSVAGKTIVLTGPTPTSLGAVVVELLASHPTSKPASIILLGRSIEKVQPLITKLNTLSPSTTTPFIPIDLLSQSSIRDAAKAVIALAPKIDVVLNNAGVMGINDYSVSADGVEQQFAINHLGHFLLTNLLLSATPSIFNPSARIISISSEGHVLGAPRFSSLTSTTPLTKETALAAVNFGANGENYDPWLGYGQSKSANVLFARSLAKKLAGRDIQAFSLHPGMIFGTGLAVNLVEPNWDVIFKTFDVVDRKKPGIKTLEEGISTIVFASLDEGIATHSGEYLDDCKVATAMPWASDDGNADKLWEVSEVLVGEKFEY